MRPFLSCCFATFAVCALVWVADARAAEISKGPQGSKGAQGSKGTKAKPDLVEEARPPGPSTPPAAAGPGDIFERGRIAFDRGEYARAIELLRPMLYPGIRLDEESQVVRSHRMLGVAHLFENQPSEARQEFLRLLELRPDYRFDPLLDPPRVVDFFNEILRDQEAQIASLERRRNEAEKAEANRVKPRPNQILERNYERHSLAVALIPFGAGQFQNGQANKGWMFMGAESALAVVSLAAFTTNFLLYGTSYTLPCKNEPNLSGGASGRCDTADVDRTAEERSSLLLNVQLVSGGLFFAVATWGVVDALLHHKETVMVGAPRLVPASGTELSQRTGLKVSVFPALLGDRLGGGLALRF